jgi:hypothetical protein
MPLWNERENEIKFQNSKFWIDRGTVLGFCEILNLEFGILNPEPGTLNMEP